VQGTLVLHYQQGFSFEELGVVFGEKPGVLMGRVMRALPLLRRYLEAHFADHTDG
jgi:DNA-directed RNA polymerase specialized sigma24 family protein